MGKVGSTSVQRSLAASGVHLRTFHVHWLTPDRLSADESLYLRAARRHRGGSLEKRFHPRYVWEGQHLVRDLSRRPDRPRKVITLVRDPVARDVSSFFQNLLLFFGEDHGRVADEESLARVARRLCGLFVDNYATGRTQHDADPRDWLDEQLRPVFDVDVYRSRFPRESGYEIYESGSSAVLLMRMEDLDSCAGVAFKQFLGIEDFGMTNANVGTAKGYASLYETFKRELTLPRAYLDSMYGSRMARHFYSTDELSEFRRRWTEY